ncbi:MAG: von Willebrand factor type A domain-containing protein, partial [Balneolaceae bacterium]|nr:von Willebrand factor type A domain-containing protein [Balneolaceae bacterium]
TGAVIEIRQLNLQTVTDRNGNFSFRFTIRSRKSITLRITTPGYKPADKEVRLDKNLKRVEVYLEPVGGTPNVEERDRVDQKGMMMDLSQNAGRKSRELYSPYRRQSGPFNTESYDHIDENRYYAVADRPLSTFSIDVDAASYSNMRRMINEGRLPVRDAVRIEEMINYFEYDYPGPAASGAHPFSVTLESGTAYWNPNHKLVHIGIQGKRMGKEELPPSNLVFLLDVSGSMNTPRKLPLLKKAFRLLVDQLSPNDRVAIVVYAGSSGLVLPSTPASEKQAILDSIHRLRAGGSTAGAAGIRLAYRVAQEQFMEGGNNRIILATDGDFNVGVSSDAELVRLIEKKRNNGIFLTVLGFGTGNLKDSKMEKLADKGNGNYAYIDTILEAKKVLVNEIGSTLLTIAKDVKIQVEFNPAEVQAYRLIGYENRVLENEDFNDDTKDAGELGAGHSVTALYEIIPAGIEPDVEIPAIDTLKYQTVRKSPDSTHSGELLTVKLRYKDPDGEKSRLLSRSLNSRAWNGDTVSENLIFSSAVAGFGMLLRDSEFKGSCSYDMVLGMLEASKGEDEHGYRSELIQLVKAAQLLASGEGRELGSRE